MAALTGPKTFLSVKKNPPDLGEQVGYTNSVEEELMLAPNTTLSDTGQNKYG